MQSCCTTYICRDCFIVPPPRHICIPSGDATPLLLLRLLAFKRNETESFWFLLLSGVESSSSDLVPVTTVTIHVGDVLHCSESRVYRGEGACLKHLWSSPLSEYFTCSSDPYWTSLKCLMRTQHFLLRWDGAGEHKFGRVIMGLPSNIVYMSGEGEDSTFPPPLRWCWRAQVWAGNGITELEISVVTGILTGPGIVPSHPGHQSNNQHSCSRTCHSIHIGS